MPERKTALNAKINNAIPQDPNSELIEELPMLAHLKDTVRDLAVSIASAMGEGAEYSSRHVSTAIAIARDIVTGRYREKLGGSTVIAEERHGHWIVRRLDAELSLASFSRRSDAVRRGVELAGRYDVDFIVFGPKRNVLEKHARKDIRAPWLDLVRSHMEAEAAAPVVAEEVSLDALLEPKAIEVGRDGRRWTVTMPDGTTATHRTKKAAMKSAETAANALNVDIVMP